MQAEKGLVLSEASSLGLVFQDRYLLSIGFQKSEADPNLYYIVVGGVRLILLLYVDDLFITGGEHLIDACKKDLASEFKMTNFGLMRYYLGMEVWQEDGDFFRAKETMLQIF